MTNAPRYDHDTLVTDVTCVRSRLGGGPSLAISQNPQALSHGTPPSGSQCCPLADMFLIRGCLLRKGILRVEATSDEFNAYKADLLAPTDAGGEAKALPCPDRVLSSLECIDTLQQKVGVTRVRRCLPSFAPSTCQSKFRTSNPTGAGLGIGLNSDDLMKLQSVIIFWLSVCAGMRSSLGR